jgi:hypothetical protein
MEGLMSPASSLDRLEQDAPADDFLTPAPGETPEAYVRRLRDLRGRVSELILAAERETQLRSASPRPATRTPVARPLSVPARVPQRDGERRAGERRLGARDRRRRAREARNDPSSERRVGAIDRRRGFDRRHHPVAFRRGGSELWLTLLVLAWGALIFGVLLTLASR